MRARNIKPGFYENPLLCGASTSARFLFQALWCMADRRGRLEDRPKHISGRLFSRHHEDGEALLTELASLIDDYGVPECLLRYEVKGKRYIQIVNFHKHQRPHQNEKESIIPPPDVPWIPDVVKIWRADYLRVNNGSTKVHPTSHHGSPRLKAHCSDILNPDILNPEYKIPETGVSPPPCGEGDTDSGNSISLEPDDPLANRPDLQAFYARLRERIKEAHPRAQLPKEGSKGWHKEQHTIALLLDKDKFTLEELQKCLHWLFEAEDKQALFWRSQVQAITPLRNVKDGMSKIARIHKDWQQAEGTLETDPLAEKTDAELQHLGIDPATYRRKVS